ncbi:MAG: archease [Candidatus Zixiibacteriota bacterium]|nr:MAG: archease [candidate division Zixibacteria bacterium]UCE25751.1 MAG: archease [candidate division Zixibacteria bacterium]
MTDRAESQGHYEFVEHTADIAVKAYGESLEEAFAVAAGAMFDIMTDGSAISPVETVEFEVESVDIEGLLVGFLSDLIVLHEVQDYVLTDFEVTLLDERRLRVTARGETFDDSKHGHGHHIKGVSYHMMEIFEGAGETPSYVQVLFDV